MSALKGETLCYRHSPTYADKRKKWAAVGHQKIAREIAAREAARMHAYVAWLEGLG